MGEAEELALAEAKTIRRRILRILHIAGLTGASEHTMSLVLNTDGFAVMPMELRRHLDYLEQRQVLKIADRDKTHWHVTITPDGTDIIEGTRKAPDWIAKA